MVYFHLAHNFKPSNNKKNCLFSWKVICKHIEDEIRMLFCYPCDLSDHGVAPNVMMDVIVQTMELHQM
jgi:hypothetical protein